MSSGPRTPGPRHLAGGAHRPGAAPQRRSARPAPQPPDLDPAPVAPLSRVPRSRLAFAVAVTVAALPLLVLDNLPASAERAEGTTGAALGVDAPSTTAAPTSPTTAALPTGDALLAAAPAPTTTTTVAPSTTTTTAAPAPTTTAAPRIVSVRSTPTTQAPTTTVAPAPAPAPSGRKGDPNDPASWDAMAQCESGGNWSINTGNGYYGGLQFSLGTWQSYGGTGYPHEASKATQIAVGKRLQAAKGWAAWPGCARKLGFA